MNQRIYGYIITVYIICQKWYYKCTIQTAIYTPHNSNNSVNLKAALCRSKAVFSALNLGLHNA